jgi:TPR repeat protein
MKNHLFAAVLMMAIPALCTAGPAEDARAAAQAGDYQKAFALLLPLAEAGDVDALGNVGNMYAFGQGTARDIDKAYEYWFRAAEKHLGTAMGNIAVLYMTGQGRIKQDTSKAAGWYKLAAEHRHAPSMLTLSSLYMRGEGLEKDKVRALAWASLTATNALTPQVKQAAIEQTKNILRDSSPEEIAQAKALSKDLIEQIDANVALYRSPSPGR